MFTGHLEDFPVRGLFAEVLPYVLMQLKLQHYLLASTRFLSKKSITYHFLENLNGNLGTTCIVNLSLGAQTTPHGNVNQLPEVSGVSSVQPLGKFSPKFKLVFNYKLTCLQVIWSLLGLEVFLLEYFEVEPYMLMQLELWHYLLASNMFLSMKSITLP